jgi:alpha-1,2-mannosyltransferase
LKLRLLLLCGGLYAVVIVLLRLKHGGDLVNEIALSQRLLTGEPLYQTGPAHWTLWPPFAALLLVPFVPVASASQPVALGLWSVVQVACLVAALWLARRWGWRPALLALAATAMPIQTDLEHRNLNTLLLLLIVAATADLEDERDTRAGLWLGLATALKAFPALFLLYLALRRRWRALAVGVGVAAVATLVPLLAHGLNAGITAGRDWLALTLDQSRWQLSANDQSLRALVLSLAAIPLVARRETPGRFLAGSAATALAAVLVAPVTWVHYFVLAFPAWVALLAGPDGRGTPTIRRAGIWLAAIATSGWLTLGQGPLRRALHDANLYTWGALLLLLLLVTQLGDRQPRAQ